jgi:hypothetical protein
MFACYQIFQFVIFEVGNNFSVGFVALGPWTVRLMLKSFLKSVLST